MKENWSFSSPVEVEFGPGRVDELSELVEGEKVLLVTTPGSRRRGLVGRLEDQFAGRKLVVHDQVSPTPTAGELKDVGSEFYGQNFDTIVGLGGGSALDTAKLLSLRVTIDPGGGGVSQLQKLTAEEAAEVPELVTVPTTHGSGAEVTPRAHVWCRTRRERYVISDPRIQPDRVLVDPELSLSLSEETAVATGFNALSQGLEALWNVNSTPCTDPWAAEAVRRGFDNLPEILESPDELEPRKNMCLSGLLSGMATAQTGGALADVLAAPLTVNFGLPRGLACGILLPEIWEFNLEQDEARLREISGRVGFFQPGDVGEALEALLSKAGAVGLVKKYVGSLDSLTELAEPDLDFESSPGGLVEPDPAEAEAILRNSVRRLGELPE